MGWPEGIDPHWLWLTLGLVLAALEMIVPGVYLIWLAVAAIITGLLVLGADQLGGSMGLAGQVVSFVFMALIFAYSARRWLRESPIESSDPLMNNRTGRLVGETVQVTQAIDHGSGRVKLGDSEWLARGPDAAVGEYVRVSGAEGSVLLVERLALPGAAVEPAAG